jgi:hypothetical protein
MAKALGEDLDVPSAHPAQLDDDFGRTVGGVGKVRQGTVTD